MTELPPPTCPEKNDVEVSPLVEFLRAWKDLQNSFKEIGETIRSEMQETTLSPQQAVLEQAFSSNFALSGAPITYADGVRIELLKYAVQRQIVSIGINAAKELRRHGKNVHLSDADDAPNGGDTYIQLPKPNEITPTVRSMASIGSAVKEVLIFLTRHEGAADSY